jgi:hypothetical protein
MFSIILLIFAAYSAYKHDYAIANLYLNVVLVNELYGLKSKLK